MIGAGGRSFGLRLEAALPGALYTPELEEAQAMFGIAGDICREIHARLPLETPAS